jgi:hypothetical protein
MLGLLGDSKKAASIIISASGKRDGGEYSKEYGEGSEKSEMDMMNPVEMMASELINAIHAKDAKKTAEIFCYILDVKRKGEGVEIEINT